MVFKTISVLLPLFVLKFWFDNKFLDKVSSNAQILSTIEISWSLGFDTITFDNYLEPKKRGKVVQKLACYLAILCEFFSEYLSEALVFDLFQIGFYPLVLCVKIETWYFTSKIVLTYCEKNCFSNLFKRFEITRTRRNRQEQIRKKYKCFDFVVIKLISLIKLSIMVIERGAPFKRLSSWKNKFGAGKKF